MDILLIILYFLIALSSFIVGYGYAWNKVSYHELSEDEKNLIRGNASMYDDFKS